MDPQEEQQKNTNNQNKQEQKKETKQNEEIRQGEQKREQAEDYNNNQQSQNHESSQALQGEEGEWQDQSESHSQEGAEDEDEDQSDLIVDSGLNSMEEPAGQGTEPILGCEHYQRNCLVQAPCCKIFYTCKLCHDDKYEGPKSNGCKVERMQFDKVEHLKCLKCEKVQPPSEKCVNSECQVTFGKYACLKCKLYENKASKVDDIFHCDDCKMCRRGKRQAFFHCKVCGYCRPMFQKDNHRCTEDSGMSQCPICLEVLKFSTKYYSALPCGHLIHNVCLRGLRAINCPVCGMAIQKLDQRQNQQIDAMIASTKGNLPPELKDKKVDILCNQCLAKTKDAPFHFFGIKCQSCGTYNTKMI